MGAGVIPLAVHKGELFFLFQQTFSGRKTGYLIDFGGGINEGESYLSAAIREFIEETDTLYFSSDLERAYRSEERVEQQIPQLEALFEKTLSTHPEWWCRRALGNKEVPKDWRTYFIEFPFRDIAPLNQLWELNSGGRFKKRRQLVWLSAETLLALYASEPKRLWKRVRQLEGAEALIHNIQSHLTIR
ncbi:MAG: NUDIX domain-containing protein [Gammaproteobacteria bacterium]|jgi:8-oxo-dGTP pyrophosphatase MutT (NUDIX family)|nr:NUDIX domain-containing protein [Gammaproteobacteria bacterium]MBT7307483.1 NUDIX domain-containing protein [Gammaproteobacteria bacterium]